MAWYRCGMNGTYNAMTVSRSGAICNYVANVGGVPLSRFIANITPIQAGSGDPSPSNPRAITGWSVVNVTRTGKNVWSYGNVSGTQRLVVTVAIKAGTYTLSANVTSSDTDYDTNLMLFYYEDGTTESIYINRGTRQNVTFTLLKNVKSINFYASRNNNAGAGDTFSFTDIQLEVGSTPSTYEPYTGQAAVINLNGTFYLATLNVLTGLLTVLGKYLVFNLAEYYGTYGDDNAPLFYVDITGEGIARMNNADYDIFLISNMLSKITTTTQKMKNYEIRTDNTPTRFYFRMDDYTSKAAIDAFLTDNPLQVVAELVTPVTYQLTPAQITQILGENNVWCDSGDSEVDFFKIIRT